MPASTFATEVREQTQFESRLPAINRTLNYEFRWLRPWEHEVKTADALGLDWMYFVRLDRQGKNPLSFITRLADFAARHALAGRSVVSSRRVTRTDRSRSPVDETKIRKASQRPESLLAMVEDRRPSPSDMAALRIDFTDWLSRLSGRQRSIALELASGTPTQQAAKRFHVTPGRISQYRVELRRSWEAFRGVGGLS
jgi:hypothetical protein